jgi:hypothetical protein
MAKFNDVMTLFNAKWDITLPLHTDKPATATASDYHVKDCSPQQGCGVRVGVVESELEGILGGVGVGKNVPIQ